MEQKQVESLEQELKQGETVKFTEEYDLYGLQLEGLKGMFYKEMKNGKYLIHVSENGEWCEMMPSSVKRTRPGFVTKRNQKFCSRIKTMVDTYGI